MRYGTSTSTEEELPEGNRLLSVIIVSNVFVQQLWLRKTHFQVFEFFHLYDPSILSFIC